MTGNETAAHWRQPIFHFRRHDAVIPARNKPTGRERLKFATQHTRGDLFRFFGAAQQPAFEFAVAPRAVLQIPQQAQLIFIIFLKEATGQRGIRFGARLFA